MSRFRPAVTTTTVRREIVTDDDDFFRSPFKSSPSTEYTTVRRRVGPTGVTTTTTTTTSPGRVRPVVTERRIHRTIGSLGDSFDDDAFFDRTPASAYRPASKLTRQVSTPADEFRVQFEVGEFKASEIEVKTRNGVVLVNAKHAGGAGSITKEFTQRCELPEGVDPLLIRACLSPLGILTIKAPRDTSRYRHVSTYERNVPVRMTTL